MTVKSDFENLIKDMKWDDDPNFNETPARVTKWLEGYQGLSKEECYTKSIEDLSKRFPTNNSNMVVVGPTKSFSLCPHHLLPIEYDVWVGYLPGKEVCGLSKIPRVVQNFSRYPFIQEDFTDHIADAIEQGLQTKGVMVWVKGVHNCMRMRGVKQPEALTTTSALRGYFRNPPEGKDPRSEFLEAITQYK
jgi:GTP cyclohydrolase I